MTRYRAKFHCVKKMHIKSIVEKKIELKELRIMFNFGRGLRSRFRGGGCGKKIKRKF